MSGRERTESAEERYGGRYRGRPRPYGRRMEDRRDWHSVGRREVDHDRRENLDRHDRHHSMDRHEQRRMSPDRHSLAYGSAPCGS